LGNRHYVSPFDLPFREAGLEPGLLLLAGLDLPALVDEEVKVGERSGFDGLLIRQQGKNNQQVSIPGSQTSAWEPTCPVKLQLPVLA
jgi:hypothetical protein